MAEHSDEGMYPGAHPTAPGGMSQAALRLELKEVHGISMDESRDMSWPQMINEVCQQRLAREAERKDLLEEAREGGFLDDIKALGTSEEQTDIDAILSETEENDMSDDLDDTDLDAELAEMADLRRASEQDEEAARLPSLFLGMPGVLDYVFDGHMGAGPSAAERWVTCTASLGAVRAFLETLTPNQQAEFAGANMAARQGTTAHAVGETRINVMLGAITPEEAENTLLELSMEPLDGEEYNEDMEGYVTEYVDLVKQYVDSGRPVLIEERVEAAIPVLSGGPSNTPPPWAPEGYYVITGKGDTIVMPSETENVLTVVDLKYGEGIDVEVEENHQERIYALGALTLLVDEEGNLPELDHVEYVICQPRLGGIKVWTESLDDLLDWRDEVLTPALTAALGGADYGAEFNPTDVACQWCPVRGSCPALAEQRVQAATELFDVVTDAELNDTPLDATTLDNARLADLLAQIEGLVSLKDDLKAEAQRRLYRGSDVPGFCLVNYTPPRKWREGAQDRIAAGIDLPTKQRDALFKDPTLITPTAAEKVLGQDYAKIIELVDKPDKRPVVAKVGDRRSLWEGTPPEAMFDIIEED